MISTCTVTTSAGEKYLTQLCKHWEHHLVVVRNGDSAQIDFGDQIVAEVLACSDNLRITINCPQLEDLEDMEGVLADHIMRFAFREQLHFAWLRDELQADAPNFIDHTA